LPAGAVALLGLLVFAENKATQQSFSVSLLTGVLCVLLRSQRIALMGGSVYGFAQMLLVRHTVRGLQYRRRMSGWSQACSVAVAVIGIRLLH
jgi:hypothetical protein